MVTGQRGEGERTGIWTVANCDCFWEGFGPFYYNGCKVRVRDEIGPTKVDKRGKRENRGGTRLERRKKAKNAVRKRAL